MYNDFIIVGPNTVAVGGYALAALFAERRESEARLARANMLLERERDDKLMSAQAIAGAIAHEVRQPLTGIVLNLPAALSILQDSNWRRPAGRRNDRRTAAARGSQAKYCPPFAVNVEPVISPASSEARNTTQRAISSGSPSRPMGICGSTFFCSTSCDIALTMSVAM
jgi:signal transduction histidine kinase